MRHGERSREEEKRNPYQRFIPRRIAMEVARVIIHACRGYYFEHACHLMESHLRFSTITYNCFRLLHACNSRTSDAASARRETLPSILDRGLRKYFIREPNKIEIFNLTLLNESFIHNIICAQQFVHGKSHLFLCER